MSPTQQWALIQATRNQRRTGAAAAWQLNAHGLRSIYIARSNSPIEQKPEIPMEVVERIKAALSPQPVVLFMKGTPDFPAVRIFRAGRCGAARTCGANFHA